MTQTATLPKVGTWNIDPTHSDILFTVKHLVAAKVRGSFKSFTGTIVVGDAPEQSSVRVSIDPTSIDTGTVDRDNHLRSEDFLSADEFPEISFVSTSVESADAGQYRMVGDLSIKGVVNPVTLDLVYSGLAVDPYGNEKALFSAETKINREDWGLVWNAPLEAGGWLVGKEVTIEIEAQAVNS